MKGSAARVLVTGATGFTGGHLTRRLLARRTGVRVLIRPSKVSDPSLRDLPLEIAEGDLRDEASLRRATEGIDTVFHVAAMYREAGRPEAWYHEVNARGTERLLEASLRSGVRRFIHCSTIGVLGNIANPPADERTPYNPGDEYQRSKMEGEKAALRYGREEGLSVAVIRPAAIYGPGDLRLFKLFRMIARRRAVILGDGSTHYHLVHVEDLVTGFLLAAESEAAPGEVFIVAHDGFVSMNELYALIARALDVPLRVIHLPVGPVRRLAGVMETILPPLGLRPPLYRRRVDFFTKNRAFTTEKARKVLGFTPAYSLERGIEETAAWYRERGLL